MQQTHKPHSFLVFLEVHQIEVDSVFLDFIEHLNLFLIIELLIPIFIIVEYLLILLILAEVASLLFRIQIRFAVSVACLRAAIAEKLLVDLFREANFSIVSHFEDLLLVILLFFGRGEVGFLIPLVKLVENEPPVDHILEFHPVFLISDKFLSFFFLLPLVPMAGPRAKIPLIRFFGASWTLG